MQRHSCKKRKEVKRRSLSRRVHAKRARLQFQLSALAENSIRRGSSCFSSNGLISNYRDIYLSWRVARSQGPRSKLADSFFHLSQIIFCFADDESASEFELGKQSKIGCKYIFAAFVFKCCVIFWCWRTSRGKLIVLLSETENIFHLYYCHKW